MKFRCCHDGDESSKIVWTTLLGEGDDILLRFKTQSVCARGSFSKKMLLMRFVKYFSNKEHLSVPLKLDGKAEQQIWRN